MKSERGEVRIRVSVRPAETGSETSASDIYGNLGYNLVDGGKEDK